MEAKQLALQKQMLQDNKKIKHNWLWMGTVAQWQSLMVNLAKIKANITIITFYVNKIFKFVSL